MELFLATGNLTRTGFSSRIEIEGDLTRRERIILLNSARHCDVHKILRGQIIMQDELFVNGEQLRRSETWT